MIHYYVIVSGIPASGKTVLARQLGAALGLPVIDKDDFLEELFTVSEDADPDRRRVLSRESDVAFQRAARQATHAILVSFWHTTGMRPDSGTPTTWLVEDGHGLVHLYCVCEPSVAADRFLARARHPAHGDRLRSRETVVAEFQTLAAIGPPAIGDPIRVDTTGSVDVVGLAKRVIELLD